MAGKVRTSMIDGAVQLLASRGIQGTSFSEVLELTGAPRGSVYHHFPGGKDELVAAAVDHAAARALELLDRTAGAPAQEVAAAFLNAWRTLLTRGDYAFGCAVVAVTVATDSPVLLERAAAAFRGWRQRLSGLLAEGGLPSAAADRFAVTLIAASEGAVVLSRAERSLEPFELVAEHLLEQVRTATAR
ncbi:AcrR family transcriptional regulator [Allocatelliglobosispora scoriae]|uniref:AcrR family transcriptional regulator n=1 Tax=Allocatelliglobosispora scoriae TaxID=643052 RepID=A0A841BLE3_9ACTN|nr:TetR/AcrR family transcriptional regulator [Allocatelliglobosispora scoriae]MBB5868019.1 AcrR family transcriptional regulator [Allocatelliglobosispora scoriae]